MELEHIVNHIARVAAWDALQLGIALLIANISIPHTMASVDPVAVSVSEDAT
jgi:hypothetical protein